MSLQPKVSIVQALTGGITVMDATGAYDPVANPGGWGTPNAAKAAVTGILLSSTPLALPELGVVRLSSQDVVNYLYQGGVTAPIQASRNPDGVYVENARIGFAGANVTSVAGSLQFTMTGANTVFAEGTGADGFTIDSLSPGAYYQIDRTQPLTETGGFVTTPLPVAQALPSTTYLLCTVNALVYQAGFNCLNADIAGYAGTCDCCSGEDLDGLLNRYAEYLAMLNKFNLYGDYAGASTLAKKLQGDCQKKLGNCFVQGTQTNVPFTGNSPMIVTQPESISVASGGQAAFGVAATGTAPLMYQWYFNGVIMPGQVGSTLIIYNAGAGNAGNYYVVVSNAFGSVTSNTVALTVGATTVPVSITQQPTNQSAQIGGSATFTVAATGTGPITYQWYANGSLIAGQTNPSLTISNIQNVNIVPYYCIVTGPTNNVQSNTVNIQLGVTVGWGWTANAVPQQSDINAAQGSGTIVSGSPLVADFRANTSAMVLFAFEPSSEPVKTQWYGSVNNNGAIGDPNNDLFVYIIIGSTRVYYSIYPTLQTQTTIQFLTSSQSPS